MASFRNREIHSFQAVCCALIALVGVISVGECSIASGAETGCLPPTPSPCAADGVCRPNHKLFGYSQTRWRRWPGDPLPEEPTLADEDTDSTVEDEMELVPFKRPEPEEEDIRGPEKTNSFTPPADDSPQALPESEDDDSFDLDLQSGTLILPAMPQGEDAPPALPPGLREIVAANQLVHFRIEKPKSTRADRSQQPKQSPHAVIPAAAEERVGVNVETRADKSDTVGASPRGNARGNRHAIYYRTVNRAKSSEVE